MATSLEGQRLADAVVDLVPSVVELPLRVLIPARIGISAHRVDRAHVAVEVAGVDGLRASIVAGTITT